MTRKPDGWVVKDYQDYLRLNCQFSFHPQKPKYSGEEVEHVPLCLVPPALLDWVEEVEKYLKVTLYNCTLNGFEMLASEEKALFDKLREVRGYGT